MTKKSRASPHSLEPTKLTSDGPCKVQMPPAPLHHNSLSSDKAVTPQITNGAIPPVVVSTACTSSFGGSSAGSAAATGSRTIAAADHTMLDNRVPRAAAAPSAGVVPTAFSGFMARGLPANAKPVNPPALGLGPPGANGANAYEEENKPPRPLVSSGDFIVRLRLARCLQPRHWQRQKRPFRTCLVRAVFDRSPILFKLTWWWSTSDCRCVKSFKDWPLLHWCVAGGAEQRRLFQVVPQQCAQLERQ